MAFFFGSRRGGGGGGGGGLLPSTSKPKAPRKPFSAAARRRSHIRDLFSPTSTFFALGLSISLLFFVAVVIRYGVPKTPSSLHSKPRLVRRPAFRRPANVAGGKGNVIAAAAVDITTKDLYDRIEFLDVNGGAWKQGWNVTYVGNEWDKEKLKVFVVPHSHNDPGWKLTVEEYYHRQSRHILDTIVESLSKDTRRKFIWEEMSYLERWWRDASELKRETFTKLVKNGQLEIVGGGWVMNDEVSQRTIHVTPYELRIFVPSLLLNDWMVCNNF